MTYRPHQVVAFKVRRSAGGTWSPETAGRLIGQQVPLVQFDGMRYNAEVVAAAAHGSVLLVTLLVGDPE